MDTILTTYNGVEFTIGAAILEFSYLLAAILFVYGLKLLSRPETARKGNFWAAVGMVLAMITTLLLHTDTAGSHIPLTNAIIIIITVAIGSIVGLIISKKVKMTAMPQLVSIFNATGGLASALVGLLEFSNPGNESLLVTLLGLIVGSIAFSGSMIAYGKLDGKIGNVSAVICKPYYPCRNSGADSLHPLSARSTCCEFISLHTICSSTSLRNTVCYAYRGSRYACGYLTA